MCFDNINQHTTARHYSSTHGNKQINMVQAYAALNRISSEGLDSTTPDASAILNIDMHEFVPSDNDVALMKSSVKVISLNISPCVTINVWMVR